MTVFDIFLQQLLNGIVLGSFYALVALGYSQVDADRAVRSVVESGSTGDVSVIVRAALSKLTSK